MKKEFIEFAPLLPALVIALAADVIIWTVTLSVVGGIHVIKKATRAIDRLGRN